MRVPKITEVVAGAGVSIVLKKDQPTGREVQGTVGRVLTNGNHPRGIKVMLQDGRVGRVQRMANAPSSSSSGAAAPASAISSRHPPTPGQGSSTGFPGLDVHQNPRAAAQRPRYTDVRLDDHLEAPPERGLADFIVAPKRKGKGKGKGKGHNKPKDEAGDEAATDEQPSTGQGQAVDVSPATATCPLCGIFEGDEVAVSHHVDSEHLG